MVISARLFFTVILVPAEPGWEREVKLRTTLLQIRQEKASIPAALFPKNSHSSLWEMGFAHDRDVPTLGELLWKFFVLVNLGNPWCRALLQALSTAGAVQSFSCSKEVLRLNTQNLLIQVEK